MQFETMLAVPGQVPCAGCIPRRSQNRPGPKFNDLNFRIAKKCFDSLVEIGRLILAQVNVGAPSDQNHRIPIIGGNALAPGQAVSTANFGAN